MELILIPVLIYAALITLVAGGMAVAGWTVRMWQRWFAHKE